MPKKFKSHPKNKIFVIDIHKLPCCSWGEGCETQNVALAIDTHKLPFHPSLPYLPIEQLLFLRKVLMNSG